MVQRKSIDILKKDAYPKSVRGPCIQDKVETMKRDS